MKFLYPVLQTVFQKYYKGKKNSFFLVKSIYASLASTPSDRKKNIFIFLKLKRWHGKTDWRFTWKLEKNELYYSLLSYCCCSQFVGLQKKLRRCHTPIRDYRKPNDFRAELKFAFSSILSEQLKCSWDSLSYTQKRRGIWPQAQSLFIVLLVFVVKFKIAASQSKCTGRQYYMIDRFKIMGFKTEALHESSCGREKDASKTRKSFAMLEFMWIKPVA